MQTYRVDRQTGAGGGRGRGDGLGGWGYTSALSCSSEWELAAWCRELSSAPWWPGWMG